MNKEMIISSGGHDTRVAILEDDQVVEVFIERENQRGVVGNIYKGRVSKVLPGMQSSFIDIGLERDAFLYVSEVVNTVEEFERLESGDEDDDGRAGGGGGCPAAPRRRRPAAAPPGSSRWRAPTAVAGIALPRVRPPQAKIEDLLKEGQEILVQVVKEPLGTKGARLTSHVTMPGRFLVFMPTVDHVGVSRKIESREERSRLRGIVRQFREEHGFTGGVIIRTAAGNRPERDIISDLSYFHQVWTEVRQKMESRRPPALLFQEQSLVTKLLRDLLTEDYTAIRIDDEAEHRRVVALIERIMPNLLPRVKHYTKDFPIFEEYGVQGEIDKALRPKVWLKSGGYLVINQTEALVAIDVNTGRYVGKKSSRPARRHDRQDQPRGGQGDRPSDPAARPGRHHRSRPDRHGGEEEPAESLPGGREGAAQGSLAVEGLAGVGLRAGDRDPQARQAEPRAPADRALPVLLGIGVDQIERDDLLRDSVGAAEDRPGSRRTGRCPAGESGYREGAQGRGTPDLPRSAAFARQAGDDPAGRTPPSRTVRRDGDLESRDAEGRRSAFTRRACA